MMHIKILLILFLLCLPLPVFASGNDVLIALYIEGIVNIVLIISILALKWKISGKLVLLLSLFAANIFAFSATSTVPYTENAVWIDVVLGVFPIVVVSIVYWCFRNKFRHL